MPLPAVVLVAFATGIAAAIAGRTEIRLSPRPPLLTRAFAAYAALALLVIVPISIYFYVFHGDWFLLYYFDVRRIPSAIALVGFAFEAAIGAMGFLLGAQLVRAQREAVGGALSGLALVAAAIVVFTVRHRLAVVGSYAQFVGGFGLSGVDEGPMFQGIVAMGSILLLASAAVLGRLWLASTRG